ncbi:hypothetical protein L9F63_021991 [Diploptera punctata]|uniref:Lipase domain-containing protein n=1 Tax=Diploptera punctata TaxID=6984 RepID=A0AAD7ZNC1_DIPPU|nr:hypothetical protein L9F63_021991 [Diploptera punctata]
MPFFVTVDKDQKLDATDAEFVDVIHTNAFVQGKIEASGDVDFYVNGGINQPGCWNEANPFGCDHHRAPAYFAESINSKKGFYGWSCGGFFYYLMGLCPPRHPSIIMGDHVPIGTHGFYLVKTAAESPFALGPWLIDPLDDIKTKKINRIPGSEYIDNHVDTAVVEAMWTQPVVLLS